MKLAFIGTGKNVSDALGAVEPVENLERTAIFARPRSKAQAQAFADQYQIPEVYTDYTQLLEESTADTVYIGLINSAHYPYAKQALEYGKNVILEKPFTGFYDQAVELRDLAKEKGRFIFEAVTILHNEVFTEMKKNVAKLGNIKMALCNYSQYSSRYDAYKAGGKVPHAFDPAFYGGALYDINVYNVHYCVGLFGEPNDATYYPNLGPNGVDTSGILVLSYDGFSAVCTGAKDSDSPCYLSFQGDQGFMHVASKPNIASELTTTYVDPNNHATVRDAAGAEVRATITEDFKAGAVYHRMTQEFSDFSRMIDEQDFAAAYQLLDESVAVVGVLEKARVKAGIEFPRN